MSNKKNLRQRAVLTKKHIAPKDIDNYPSLKDEISRLGGDNKPDPVKIFCYLTVFALTFLLVYIRMTKIPSDYMAHLKWAQEFSFRNPIPFIMRFQYPMWHILVNICNRLGMAFDYSAAFVSACLNLAVVMATHKIFELFLKNQCNKNQISVLSLSLSFVAAIYMPWYNPNVYTGQGSPTIWHNPTYAAVKVFAAVIPILFVYFFYENQKRGYKNTPVWQLLTLSVLCFLSVLAKPSFLQGFIPALGIFLLVELILSKGESLLFCFKTAAALIPSVLWMGMQFFRYFDAIAADGENGIIFIWPPAAPKSPNFLISTLLCYGFPLFVVIVYERKRIFKDKYLWLTILFTLITWLEAYCLSETAARANSGNFHWARYHAIYSLFVITTIRFMQQYQSYLQTKNYTKKKSFVFSAGWLLAFSHLIAGIYHYSVYWETFEFL